MRFEDAIVFLEEVMREGIDEDSCPSNSVLLENLSKFNRSNFWAPEVIPMLRGVSSFIKNGIESGHPDYPASDYVSTAVEVLDAKIEEAQHYFD